MNATKAVEKSMLYLPIFGISNYMKCSSSKISNGKIFQVFNKCDFLQFIKKYDWCLKFEENLAAK